MDNQNMEVARMDGGAVVVRDPFDGERWYHAANVAAFVGSARARLAERREQFDALGEIADAPLDAVKKLRWAIEADDKVLKDFDGKFKDALLLRLQGVRRADARHGREDRPGHGARQVRRDGRRAEEARGRGEAADAEAHLLLRRDGDGRGTRLAPARDRKSVV